jgi:hypothetical protein
MTTANSYRSVARWPCAWMVLTVILPLMSTFSPALAAQETAASIVGQVRDESGGVLPGVTVIAKSPALQVPEVMSVTDERGEYRLTPLPIGTYIVEYTLSGFQPVRQESLRLTVGFVAKLDMVLKVGALSETVTVSGVSPVVDVTSTAATTQFTRETIELLPTARNGIISLLAQSPGVRADFDVGGSNMSQTPNFRAFGQSHESWSTLEGVLSTPPNDGGAGNYWDYASFEEAAVRTVANDAEMPRRGILLTGIVKSGGNDFHGGAYWGQTSDRFQSKNVDDELRAAGLVGGNKLKTRWDVSAELGGRFIRDKLWFYGSLRQRHQEIDLPNAFKPDGSPAQDIQEQPFVTGKLSYQMSSANRLVGFYQYMQKHWVRGATEFVPWESRTDERTRPRIRKIEWQHVHGNALMTSLQYGQWKYNTFYDGFAPTKVATTDIRTLYVSGEGTTSGNIPRNWRDQAKGSLSWYRPDLFLGNHDFKMGFDFLSSGTSRQWTSRASGNYRLVFDNGVPFQIETWNYPLNPTNSDRYFGLFVKDSWVIRRRLTLDLGVRYAHDNGFVPAQCRDAADFAAAQCFPKIQLNIWNTVAPRVHVAYDLTGRGRTVIKGGWGRFDHMREVQPEVDSLNRNAATTTTWLWHDLNNDRAWDRSETNLDPNGPDFISLGGSTTGGTPDAVPNPNEREPKADEFSLSLEHELMANFAVRVTGVYSNNFNTYRLLNIARPYEAYNIPITNPDPGPDGVLRTADDPGTFVTYYDYPASLRGLQFANTMLINPPGHDYTYTSFEIAASKRLSDRWQFMMSYSTTKSDIPGGSEQVPYNPNSNLFLADHTREWLFKASGVYLFPYQINVSANFEHRSGNPQARTVLFRGGRQIPSITVPVEPLGSIRLPNLNLLDLRLEKRFRLTRAQNVAVRVNVFNALNINTVTNRVVRSGATYLFPTAIVLPRILDFSASYNF